MVKNFSFFSDLDHEIVYCSGHGNCDTAELPAKVPSDQARYKHIRPGIDILGKVQTYQAWYRHIRQGIDISGQLQTYQTRCTGLHLHI